MTVEINRAMGIEIFYGVVEAFHLDIILAIIIHVALRDKIDQTKKFLNLFSIFLLAVMTLGLMTLYAFMGFKVRRLTQSFYKFLVLEIKDMKDEQWRFILEDKVVRGNVFQRHFSLLNLLKDVVFCLFLFFAYARPLAIVVIISLCHTAQMVCTFLWPPYLLKWQNTLLKINSVFYVLIDLGFFVNIVAGSGMTISTRYYFIGFTLIVLVCLLILANVGFNTYYGVMEMWAKFKKWRERRKNKVAARPAPGSKPSESFEQIKQEKIDMDLSKASATSPISVENPGVMADPLAAKDRTPNTGKTAGLAKRFKKAPKQPRTLDQKAALSMKKIRV